MFVTPILLSAITVQPSGELSRAIQAGMFLGSRVAKLESKLPVVNQVVLVPDEATYLDEIAKWSTDARWPILFDQEPYASQFIRSFEPETVWRRTPCGKDITDKETAMRNAVANAWSHGETEVAGSIEEALTSIGVPPSGVVFTNTQDAARTAAVALAAGRGQLLETLQANWCKPNEVLSESLTSSLQQTIEQKLQNTGVQYDVLGDTIDAITLCQTMPARVHFSAAVENPVALTDVVGRDDKGNRFAWTGWVFGSKAQSTYMAMSSLFLERDQYWFCNTYPDSGGWGKYGVGTLPETLESSYGVHAEVVEGNATGLRIAEAGGVETDVLYFTTKGNQDFLEMSDERIAPSWLPILDKPTALYFLHSWSLKNPTGKATVGGIWLSRGVYAYIGSSHEPMLSAFVPPSEMLRRTMSGIPFLVAARWNPAENMYARAWRVNTIGDPLMLCPPNNSIPKRSIPAQAHTDYENLNSIDSTAMQTAQETSSEHSFAKAIEEVNLLGNDTMVKQLWEIAISNGVANALVAEKAMPALFRLQEFDSFLRAFSTVTKPSGIEKDMLWQLAGIRSDAPLQLLIENIRKPYEVDDILLIRNRVERTHGVPFLVDLIERTLQNARGRNQRELKRLLKEYNG